MSAEYVKQEVARAKEMVFSVVEEFKLRLEVDLTAAREELQSRTGKHPRGKVLHSDLKETELQEFRNNP